MKKFISLLLAVVLVLGLAMPVFAAAPGDIILKYSLDAGGSHEVIVKNNDVITVTYRIINTHEEDTAETETTQDQIKYDHNFFDLVDGSVKIADGDKIGIEDFNDVFETSTPIESDSAQTHYIYYNSKSTLNIYPEEELIIGQFKLRVKATSGYSVVTNTFYKAFDAESIAFGSECQDLIVRFGDAQVCEHSEKGVLQNGQPATETAAGFKDYYQCSSCNAYFEDEDCTTPISDLSAWIAAGGNGYIAPISAVSGAKYYASLTLNDNINVNFRMTHSPVKDKWGDNFQWNKVEVLVDDQPITLEQNSKGDVVGVLKKVSPKDIGVPMKIVIMYDGNVEKTIENYSVEKYCRSVCGSPSYPENNPLHKLCKAVLNYGKYADDYANSKTNSLVNKDYAIDFTNVAIPESYKYTFVADANTVSSASAHLAIHSDITLVYKIETVAGKTLTKNDIQILNNLGQKVDPANIEITNEQGTNVIKIKNIGASKLSRLYTLTLNDSQTFSLTYGVYSYCYGAQTQQEQDYTDTLKTLCKAIYNYGEAAKEYAASLSN